MSAIKSAQCRCFFPLISLVVRFLLVTLLIESALAKLDNCGQHNWPGWRNTGLGISNTKSPPLLWDAQKNILWNSPLSGEGKSSPIVWGEKIFLTSSEDDGQKRFITCFSTNDGKVLWKCLIKPSEKTGYNKTGFAAPTPVTDGKRVYAFFDSPGLVAIDMDGNLLWTQQMGPFDTPFNMGSSPMLYKDSVILCCDHLGQSFITALDCATGEIRWRLERDVSINCSTPLLIWSQGQPQIVTAADKIISYDPETGEQLWYCSGMKPNVHPTPVFSNGLVYATSGRNGPTMAIDPTGRGDITETHIKTHLVTGGPYVPSPLVYPWPYIFVPSDNGTMRFVDPKGNVIIKHRIQDRFTASPVAADNKIYWISEKAKTYVIDISHVADANPKIDILAVNQLEDESKCSASPAFVDDKILIRTEKALFCISGTETVEKVTSETPMQTRSFDELKTLYNDNFAAQEDPKAMSIRFETIEAISKLNHPEAIPFILQAIRKDHWDISEEAVKLLGQRGKDATPTLIELLKDERPFIRFTAAEYLGKLNSEAAVSSLIETSKDKEPLVQSASLLSLGQIAKATIAETDKIAKVLITALEDDNGVIKQAAIDALAMLGDKENKQSALIVENLMDALADQNPLVVSKARDALLKEYKMTEDIVMQDEFLYGIQRKKSIVRHLSAGPIRIKFADGELRYLYVGDKEIVRRIYFAVRDKIYDTMMPSLTNININQKTDSFDITFDATCRIDTADYKWQGHICGSSEGKITFHATGQGNADFKSGRIGINVLYGADSLGGQSYETIDKDGTVTKRQFPVNVSSELLVSNTPATAKTLRYTTDDGMTVICDLSDDCFAMEDQRNFCDSSYKAFYAMDYQYPDIRKQQKASQTFTLEVKNAETRPSSDSQIRIQIGKVLPGIKMPKLVPTERPSHILDFYQINKERKTDSETLIWTFCPAAHQPDEDTFIENAPAIVDQVRTVRSFAPKAKIHINPITIKPPYPRPGCDPRNKGLFAAALSAVLVKQLALAKVDEAGFDIGPDYAKFIQQDLGKYQDKPVLATTIQGPPGPLSVEVLAIEDNTTNIIWLINQTAQQQSLILEDISSNAQIKNKTLKPQPQMSPSFSDKQAPRNMGEILLELTPYEVCKIIVTQDK